MIRLVALAFSFLCASWANQLAAKDTQPNIIIIVADDLGYGDVGSFGSEKAKTPHMDALASDGVRFTDFHSNGAVCSPTRAAFLTGQYQQRTGIVGVVTAKDHRHTGLDPQATTFAGLLNRAGYTTALFGKWHLGYQPNFNPIRQGFDEFIGFVAGNVDYHVHLDQTGKEDWWKQDALTPEKGYTTDLITDHGVEFIERNRETPFLLYLAHGAPHYPYQGRDDPPFYTRAKGETHRPFRPGVYEEMIEVMDEGVGRIRKAVEEAGVSDDTLIFFFSDNGPSKPGSVGPLRARKGSIYEGGHRVPAMAYWPGRIPSGKVSNETIMGADLLPTMVEIAGAELPEKVVIDGVSLLSHMSEGQPLEQRPIFWGIKNRLAVRRGQYKLVTTTEFAKPALYDLKSDIGEKRDLADQHPELVQELIELLKQWHAEVNEGVAIRA